METFKNLQINLFWPKYFIKWKGKVIALESTFFYMLAAFLVVVYGAVSYGTSLKILPFLVPFAFGVYTMLFFEIKDLYLLTGHWRTQLSILKDPLYNYGCRTKEEKALESYLGRRWQAEFGQPYEETPLAKLTGFWPLLFFILGLMIYLIYL